MARGVSLHIGLNEVDPNHYKDGDGNPWKGELAACEADAHAMVDLATAQKFEVRGPLLSKQATSAAVIGEITKVAGELAPGDIFFLTYSGHGGQVTNLNPDDDPEEDDLDETWCLYDRELIDDELFGLLATFKPGVRVVICSDSCHSGTVDRGDPPDDDLPTAKQLPMSVAIATEKAHQAEYEELQRKVPKERLAAMAATVVLLSGCQDHQFSRDGRVNGAFTGALLKAWKEPTARKSLSPCCPPRPPGSPRTTTRCRTSRSSASTSVPPSRSDGRAGAARRESPNGSGPRAAEPGGDGGAELRRGPSEDRGVVADHHEGEAAPCRRDRGAGVADRGTARQLAIGRRGEEAIHELLQLGLLAGRPLESERSPMPRKTAVSPGVSRMASSSSKARRVLDLDGAHHPVTGGQVLGRRGEAPPAVANRRHRHAEPAKHLLSVGTDCPVDASQAQHDAPLIYPKWFMPLFFATLVSWLPSG